MSKINLMHGDCLELMKEIPSGSVDLVLTDPPYGTMDGGYKFPGKKDFDKWDEPLPMNNLMKQLTRVLRKNGKAALFSNEPYTSNLILECAPLVFSQRLAWKKNTSSAFLGAKKKCLAYIEDICLFRKPAPAYDEFGENKLRSYFLEELEKSGLSTNDINKIIGTKAWASHFFTKGAQFSIPSKEQYKKIQEATGFFNREWDEIKQEYGEFQKYLIMVNNEKFPSVFNLWEGGKSKSNVLEYKKDNDGYHPTQKPIALLEDLIKTYSNERDTILDFTMGSGSTGVACVNTNRNFIGIELDDNYFKIAQERISKARGE